MFTCIVKLVMVNVTTKRPWEVRYKGKSIGDVLNLTINQAVEFFENLPHLQSKLKMLQDVGLGYIKIGQPCTTLSGGESQRIKLATELSKKGHREYAIYTG